VVSGALLLTTDVPAQEAWLESAVATPVAFGRFLFTKHWLAIEIASLLLLVALIGALHIGKERPESEESAP
jgi:NADH-quinone oxidoreductase subunit J